MAIPAPLSCAVPNMRGQFIIRGKASPATRSPGNRIAPVMHAEDLAEFRDALGQEPERASPGWERRAQRHRHDLFKATRYQK